MSPRHVKAAQALARGASEYDAARAGGWSHDAALAWHGNLKRFLDRIGFGPNSPAVRRSLEGLPKPTPTPTPPPEVPRASQEGSTGTGPPAAPSTTPKAQAVLQRVPEPPKHH